MAPLLRSESQARNARKVVGVVAKRICLTTRHAVPGTPLNRPEDSQIYPRSLNTGLCRRHGVGMYAQQRHEATALFRGLREYAVPTLIRRFITK